MSIGSIPWNYMKLTSFYSVVYGCDLASDSWSSIQSSASKGKETDILLVGWINIVILIQKVIELKSDQMRGNLYLAGISIRLSFRTCNQLYRSILFSIEIEKSSPHFLFGKLSIAIIALGQSHFVVITLKYFFLAAFSWQSC